MMNKLFTPKKKEQVIIHNGNNGSKFKQNENDINKQVSYKAEQRNMSEIKNNDNQINNNHVLNNEYHQKIEMEAKIIDNELNKPEEVIDQKSKAKKDNACCLLF